jgi:hypothetical protein
MVSSADGWMPFASAWALALCKRPDRLSRNWRKIGTDT